MSTRAGMLCLVLALLLQCRSLGEARQSKAAGFDHDAWELLPVENGSINSLSDVSDGVYSIELAETRPACSTPSPGARL
jgi:hypothetical protein